MTPQERALVTELFERLSKLESARREPDAERLIADGLARAPNATYALVQTVLLQDEALSRAQARIEELERDGTAQQSGGFLDNLRREGFGRGSVPSAGSKWNNSSASQGYATPGTTATQTQQPLGQSSFGQGGSFLGTAAAAAVGVIGGSMLFNGLRNMVGGAQAQSFGSPPEGGQRQYHSRLHLSRVHRAKLHCPTDCGARSENYGNDRSQGLFDNNAASDDDDFFSDGDSDFGGGDGGDA